MKMTILADRIDPKVLEFAKSETPEDDVYEYYKFYYNTFR